MTRRGAVHSPTPEAIAAHYASGYEADRLHQGAGQAEPSLLGASAHLVAVANR